MPARSPTTTARAVKRCGIAGDASPRRPAASRQRTGAADTVGAMDLLAAAASDEGGITGFLLDLVNTLGPVGVGLSILAETVIPPIPSEAVLGLAGVLINDGEMNVVPVVLFATLGSLLGAIFFYYVGRALGPRRSHAFLDRLPLVETEDVDQTFAWFERHGRSAVFLGRMVPIVRSFISVPAGVVRMPFGQFLLFTAGGSLIWNTVLIGLGVAAGDFVQDNLHYLDYAVVAVVALAIAYLVYKRVKDVRRHRRTRADRGLRRGPRPPTRSIPPGDRVPVSRLRPDAARRHGWFGRRLSSAARLYLCCAASTRNSW